MEQISLTNTAFEGNNNVYLVANGPETVLVDTGDPTGPTQKQLRRELAERDLSFSDVDRVVLTHWHHDHAGLAGVIQSESGASVHVHAADAALVAGDEDAWAAMRTRQEELFDAWDMPAERQTQLRDRIGGPEVFDTFPEVTRFRDGDVLSVGDRELTVDHVSGHAAGLCVFELRQEGREDAITGDALLPVYTPNVGGADVRVDRALEKYIRGLDRIARAEYDRAWPGHREPIDAPSARATEIIDHHEERAWRVLDAVRRLGPCDTWTVSEELFGDLEGIHVLHGPGEAHAHLEHLEREGEVVRDRDGYRLRAETAERLQARSDERWPLEY